MRTWLNTGNKHVLRKELLKSRNNLSPSTVQGFARVLIGYIATFTQASLFFGISLVLYFPVRFRFLTIVSVCVNFRGQGKKYISTVKKWILELPEFEDEVAVVQNAWADVVNPWEQLNIFESSILDVALKLNKKYREKKVDCTQGKIAITSAFIRAIFCRDFNWARILQSRYHRLSRIQVHGKTHSTEQFAEILEHLRELSETALQGQLHELDRERGQLSEQAYIQRYDSISLAFQRLLPGGNKDITAIWDESTQTILSSPADIAAALTKHWQTTFDEQQADPERRCERLRRWATSKQIPLKELIPTLGDLEAVFKELPNSSPGPDGIPFNSCLQDFEKKCYATFPAFD